ncbi:hypothetical protein [uncultured Gammaproteobacteria bacterium]|nr:hypothetical protein [uncultured Gammaproteobacteria bacterium]
MQILKQQAIIPAHHNLNNQQLKRNVINRIRAFITSTS